MLKMKANKRRGVRWRERQGKSMRHECKRSQVSVVVNSASKKRLESIDVEYE